MLKKCLFPAAGYGTRFLPATKSMPKEMMPVVSKPLIEYGVEEALEAGLALVMYDSRCLIGVITDGDVRRYLVEHDNLKGVLAADLMTSSPVTISQEAMLADAEQLIRERHLKWVVALNDAQQVVGLLERAD